MIKVESHKNLYRDPETGAIVNYDTTEYSQYINMKNKRKKEREEIESLRQEISEIKFLLKELIDGSK